MNESKEELLIKLKAAREYHKQLLDKAHEAGEEYYRLFNLIYVDPNYAHVSWD